MRELDKLVAEIGYKNACQILEKHKCQVCQVETVLTIVANRGVHHLPENLVSGELFFASEGNLDFSSDESIQKEHEKVLSAVAEKLKSKNWESVYLVPFGPNTLSMQIKLLVYRITRLETKDLFYTDNGKYVVLDINTRELIVNSG